MPIFDLKEEEATTIVDALEDCDLKTELLRMAVTENVSGEVVSWVAKELESKQLFKNVQKVRRE
jgi:hypothetical protein